MMDCLDNLSHEVLSDSDPAQQNTEIRHTYAEDDNIPSSPDIEEYDASDQFKQEDVNFEDTTLSHNEVMDIVRAGVAELVKDPLLSDLPAGVTLDEVKSQIALEYGQAMKVIVRKECGGIMPIVVPQDATVVDLKHAISRYVTLKQTREGGTTQISWRYIWRTYWLTFDGEKLSQNNKKLKDYGIRNRAELRFIKRLRSKVEGV
ncbi:PREDICTED: U11/U12 small nuclear ribonucleoprotein 25 kDa protein-like [Branchiostoma belcheri]|uniref:U11/U12 small nuclear ribonucleoprotein 25 kDa protein-like n=1 Tax=Branchiostoma belcheri TaxID=7741 RepID=A0A6P4ZW17_BRABE|nr:PREDICTED: U11/U12 small nuclear ribonucleoprotein 25 kDa protein-like [Branchiostoma belcheri]